MFKFLQINQETEKLFDDHLAENICQANFCNVMDLGERMKEPLKKRFKEMTKYYNNEIRRLRRRCDWNNIDPDADDEMYEE